MSNTNSTFNRSYSKLVLLAAILALISIAPQKTHAQTELVLHSFSANSDGCNPLAGLLLAKNVLYGTTTGCGPSGGGTVFKIAVHKKAAKDKEKIFYAFKGTPDAFLPESSVIQDAEGNLYGSTCCGGATNHGTIFELSILHRGKAKETVLYNFTGGADGFGPTGQLAMDGAEISTAQPPAATVSAISPPAAASCSRARRRGRNRCSIVSRAARTGRLLVMLGWLWMERATCTARRSWAARSDWERYSR